MINPHRIQPRDRLTLQQLFTRYLDWYIWNRQHHRKDKISFCATDLYHLQFCCQRHLDLSHEANDFRVYFKHLTNIPIRGFSKGSMKKLIQDFKLEFDLVKVLEFWEITEEEWETTTPTRHKTSL